MTYRLVHISKIIDSLGKVMKSNHLKIECLDTGADIDLPDDSEFKEALDKALSSAMESMQSILDSELKALNGDLKGKINDS